MSNRQDMKPDRKPTRRRRFVKQLQPAEPRRDGGAAEDHPFGKARPPSATPPQHDPFGQTWPDDIAPNATWPQHDARNDAPPPKASSKGVAYAPPPRQAPQRVSSSYSSAVRWLRLGLPLMALAILVGVFYSGRPSGGAQEIIFRTGQFAALQGGLRLTNPRFTGATSAGEPFMVRANWAEPDGPDPERIALNTVVGEIVQANGEKLTIQAAAGELAPKAQTVTLTGGVTLRTTDGYTATTQTLRADAKQRSMISEGQVHTHGPLGQLTAGNIRVEQDAGGVLYFENGVHVLLEKVAESRARGE
ncbi:MAG: LPS export ABC transporter periplasmic protein LptC [Rhodobacteraceae bacterium]|nr:LPS export ABC transporter periplasmic protein LptC [Paracoccaceae bacterium]